MGFDPMYESETKSFDDSMKGVLEDMNRYALIHEYKTEMVKAE